MPQGSASSGRPSSSHPSQSRPRARPCRPSSWIASRCRPTWLHSGAGSNAPRPTSGAPGRSHTPGARGGPPNSVGSQRSVRAIRTIAFHQPPKLSMYGEDGRLYPEVGALIVAPLPWPSATTDVGPRGCTAVSFDRSSSTKPATGVACRHRWRPLPWRTAACRLAAARGWCGSGSCGHAEGCLPRWAACPPPSSPRCSRMRIGPHLSIPRPDPRTHLKRQGGAIHRHRPGIGHTSGDAGSSSWP